MKKLALFLLLLTVVFVASRYLTGVAVAVPDPKKKTLLCHHSDTGDTIIYVSNQSTGAEPAFSDGTNWRIFSTRAVVS